MRADAAANRARVLAAAGEIFGEQGVEASTEEVARRAGVGVGTVFRHFPTKGDLVEAALVAHLEELAARADAPDAPPSLAVLIGEMTENGSAKLAMAGFLLDHGGLGERAAAASASLRAAVDRVLVRGQRDGSIRADVTVDEVYYLLQGLTQARSTTGADPDVRRRAVDVVVAGLSAEREQ